MVPPVLVVNIMPWHASCAAKPMGQTHGAINFMPGKIHGVLLSLSTRHPAAYRLTAEQRPGGGILHKCRGPTQPQHDYLSHGIHASLAEVFVRGHVALFKPHNKQVGVGGRWGG